MSRVVVYYHDPVEVDPKTSWTGLCPPLEKAAQINVTRCRVPQVTSTASQKLPRSLGTSRRPFVGPVKRAMRSAIVVGNKG